MNVTTNNQLQKSFAIRIRERANDAYRLAGYVDVTKSGEIVIGYQVEYLSAEIRGCLAVLMSNDTFRLLEIFLPDIGIFLQVDGNNYN